MFVTLTTQADVSSWVQRERKAKKMTKTALAKASGLSRKEIVTVESGRPKHLRFDTLDRIASALGYNLGYTVTESL